MLCYAGGAGSKEINAALEAITSTVERAKKKKKKRSGEKRPVFIVCEMI
jgi:hypothetical protein